MTPPDWLVSVLSSDAFTSVLLTAFAGIVTAIVGWVGVQFRKRILRDLSASDLAIIRQCASVAVAFVEQTMRTEPSATKLAEAVKAADKMLAGYGLDVTVETLTHIVEAAVFAEIARTPLPGAAA